MDSALIESNRLDDSIRESTHFGCIGHELEGEALEPTRLDVSFLLAGPQVQHYGKSDSRIDMTALKTIQCTQCNINDHRLFSRFSGSCERFLKWSARMVFVISKRAWSFFDIIECFLSFRWACSMFKSWLILILGVSRIM